MKILLIAPRYSDRNTTNYNYSFPLGLGYISAAIKTAGFRLDCINANHSNDTIEDILNDTLDSKRYDLVLTGNNSLGFCSTATMLKTIKDHSTRPKTILGGPIITTEPELVMEYMKPDYGVIGEGETTIVELLNCIKDDTDPKRVKGIVFECDDKPYFTENRMPINNLDDIPVPDLEAFDFQSWINNKHPNDNYYQMCFDNPRPYMILGSRGCPFKCTFCYHDNRYRERSIENIFEELKLALDNYRMNLICLNDDCFAMKQERLEEFCENMQVLRDSVSWPVKWGCQLTVKNLEVKTLKLLKESGCDNISYGFESYSPSVLRSMQKPISPEDIDFAFKNTLKEKISIQANFIFGDPAETRETATETIQHWKKHCFGQVNLDFVKPYPGSQIYKRCLENNLIDNKIRYLENGIENVLEVNMTKLSDKEFHGLARYIFHLKRIHYKYVFIKSLKRNGETYSLRIKCPFCRKKLTYSNITLNSTYNYSITILCRSCGRKYYAISLMARLSLYYYIIRYYIISFLRPFWIHKGTM